MVGRPPFETSTLKETYVRITSNNYTLPSNLSQSAATFIQKCLRHEPDQRPTVQQLLSDEFISSGFMPKSLPVSCCTNAPKFAVYTRLPRYAFHVYFVKTLISISYPFMLGNNLRFFYK